MLHRRSRLGFSRVSVWPSQWQPICTLPRPHGGVFHVRRVHALRVRESHAPLLLATLRVLASTLFDLYMNSSVHSSPSAYFMGFAGYRYSLWCLIGWPVRSFSGRLGTTGPRAPVTVQADQPFVVDF